MENMLSAELAEIHLYTRHELQVYVAWFTFFLTLLLGTMGWSLRASLDRQGRVNAPFPFYCMMTLFTVQLVLSIIATDYIRHDFKAAEQRIIELQNAIYQQQPTSKSIAVLPKSPMPHSIHVAMILMECTLISNLLFWWGVTVFVVRRRGKKLAAHSGS